MAVGARRCFPEDAMTELTRRRIVAAAVATAATGALAPFAPPAQAAAPLAGRQAPSFYRCKVGEFEVSVVNDGARAIPLPAQFVRNVGNEEVLAAAEAAYMPKGSIIAAVQSDRSQHRRQARADRHRLWPRPRSDGRAAAL